MRLSILLVALLSTSGTFIYGQYEISIDYEIMENRKRNWVEEQLDDNLIYLFFDGGFENDVFTITYGNSILNVDSVSTDQVIGMAHLEVITNSVSNITIRKSNGPIADIDLSKSQSNYWHVWFYKDTLKVQAARYAPSYE
jgi:hypothetical protein